MSFFVILSVASPSLKIRLFFFGPLFILFSLIYALALMCFLVRILFFLFSSLLYIIFRWRTMFGLAAIPSILLALGMGLSPESPRWLFQVFLHDYISHI